jgi:dihydropteroate synthase
MTELMGILNITPDSFSDGGRYLHPEAATRQFETLVQHGARFIDVGAESTRPGATPLTADEEWSRLDAVLHAIPSHGRERLSVDTRHVETARRALDMGARIINDVSGLSDPRMRALLARTDAAIIVMHSLSIPADPHILWPSDIDPIQEILRWKDNVIALAAADGIGESRLIFDPGLGFGKSAAQSLELLARAAELVRAGGRWLYGHSRKSFLKTPGDTPEARDAATLKHSTSLQAAGVHILRVHNVALHREGLCM